MEQVFNLSLRESLLRGLAAILLPMFLLLIDYHIIVYFLPVVVYLYVTAIVHICPIKHAWRRRIRHIADDNDNAFWDQN